MLCDANVGSTIAAAIADAGHDVVRAVDRLPHAADDAILAFAVSDERVLVTCDHDFGDLIFFRRHLPPPAVIFIRFEPEDVRDIVPRLLPLLDFDALRDHMTVMDDLLVRRRPFPARSEHG